MQFTDDNNPVLPQFANAIPDGISVVNAEGTHVFVNDAFCEMVGWSREELIGSGPPHLYWPESHMDEIQSAFSDTLQYEFQDFFLHFQRRDGEIFPVQVHAGPLPDGDGQFLATVKDMSRVVERERSLRRTNNLLEAIIEGGDIGTWEWQIDDATPELQFSDSYYKMLGYAPGAWVASVEEWRSRVHPDDAEEASERSWILARGEAHHTEAQYRFLDAEGRWRWLLSRGYVTEWGEDGKPARVSGTDQDISLLKEQELQLKELQKMEVLGQLTGGIAHDFNNILAIVAGNVDLLSLEVGPDQQQHIESIVQALDRARRLTGSLMKHSRRESPMMTTVDLGACLTSVQPMLEAAVSDRIQLTIKSVDAELPVQGEQVSLESALLNLVVNARDAMVGGRGRVTVTLGKQSLEHPESGHVLDYAQLIVTDNGRGMTEDVLARAQEPLFTTKPSGSGTGLGLSMVARSVADAGGFVDIQSQSQKGTRVTLNMPLLSQRATVEDADDSQPAVSESTQVLLVDDDPDVLSITARQLSSRGFDVTATEDPHEAVRLASARSFDVLVSDIVMPYSINGLQMAAKIREIREDLPMVFVSGFASQEEEEQARSMGTFLSKPFRLDQLEQAVRAKLSARK